MNVSTPPRLGVSASAAGAATVATQRTLLKAIVAKADVLIIVSSSRRLRRIDGSADSTAVSVFVDPGFIRSFPRISREDGVFDAWCWESRAACTNVSTVWPLG